MSQPSTPQALKAAATGQVAKPKPTIFDYLERPAVHKGIAAVAGKFLTADRMLRLCVNAVKKTPKLLECEPQSVLGAMMASAALGLEPNTVQQQAFLIPYKQSRKVGDQWVETYDCQFQVGARGFVTLAYRSPYVKLLTAEAIHDGDKFEHSEGSGAFLRYSKNLRDRGPLLGAFSYVELENGAQLSCVLPLDELLKIRSKSETYRALERKVASSDERGRKRAQDQFDEQPWVMWEDDMATKSAIKKHAKRLPIASNDSMAVAADLDDRSDIASGRVDLSAFTDPDLVREVVQNGAGAPALEDDSGGRQFEGGGEAFGATAREREGVEQRGDQATKPAAKKTAAAKTTPAKDAGATPAASSAGKKQEAPTYAQFAEQIKAAKDGDAAAEILDGARGQLSEDLLEELAGLYRATWSQE